MFYLRANQISRNPDTLFEDYKTAEQLYMQAIALDPDLRLPTRGLHRFALRFSIITSRPRSWENRARAEAK